MPSKKNPKNVIVHQAAEKQKLQMEKLRLHEEDNEYTRVFVRNIPEMKSWKELYEFVVQGVGVSPFVKLHVDESDGSPLGHGMLRCDSAAEANRVLKLIKANKFKGVQLDGNIAISHYNQKKYDEKLSKQMQSLSFNEDKEETYGLSKEFLVSLGIKSFPLTCGVYINNVPITAKEVDTRQLLSIAGKVVYIKSYDAEKMTQKVYAEYAHPLEAVQCVSMLKDQLYRGMHLRVYMSNPQNKKNKALIGKVPLGLQSVGAGLGRRGEAMEFGGFEMGPKPQPREWISPVYPSKPSMKPVVEPLMDINCHPSVPRSNGCNYESINQRPFGREIFDEKNPRMDYRDPGRLGFNSRGFDDQSESIDFRGRLSGNSNGQFIHDGLSRGYPSGNSNGRFIHDNINQESDLELDRYNRVFNPQPARVPAHLERQIPRNLPNQKQIAELYITNLPLDYSDSDLYKLSWNCGEVTAAEVRSPGFGLVKFSSEGEALRAAKIMNKRPLEGKIITARII